MDNDCFYEDFSVKRRASRGYLTTAAHRNGEQLQSKVGDSQGL
jgi:hypothetical protein